MGRLLRALLFLGGLLILVSGCAGVAIAQSENWLAAYTMVRPGDQIGEMTLRTGSQHAYPLWPFCLTPVQQEGQTVVSCRVPAVQALAIGYPLDVEHEFQGAEWKDLDWRFSLDDQMVDLDAFGIYTLIYPGLAKPPSHVREVFWKMQVWDVVIENAKPGLHIILGSATLNNLSYRWTINLWIEFPNDGHNVALE